MTDSRTIAELGEQHLLDLFAKRPLPDGLLVGPGDDCAVTTSDTSGLPRLLKTDCVIAGVHFTTDEDFTRVGRKALGRAISDIAAMGGTPENALITLVLPPSLEVEKVHALYCGIDEMAEQFQVRITGGETASAPPPHRDALMISIALTGIANSGRYVTRSGGSPGDQLYITGVLGGSIAGHHLDFTPRVEEGKWIASRGASAMMDLSDGLAKDLPRLAAMSQCAYRIDPLRLPLRDGSSIEAAMNDGEDYELLFALPHSRTIGFEENWATKFPDTKLTKIGQLLKLDDPSATPISGGYDHFN